MNKCMARIAALLPHIVLSMALGTLLLPATTQAAPTYTVTVIGGADSEARGLNEAGQVVGYITAGGVNRAFFYDGSVLKDLGTLGYTRSIAHGLTDNGTVVGTAYGDGIARQGFVYANGAVSALPLDRFNAASAINNAGLIVGDTYFPDGEGGNVIHGYSYADGNLTDLGTVPDGFNSFASGVNEAGHVTGTVEVGDAPNYPSHPFLYTGGPLQDLGDFGGVMQDLGSLLDNGSSAAYDINDAGLTVGVSATANENAGGAFLYVDGQMVLLDTLIDPASGWSVHNASAINEAGQIAGRACKGRLCYAVRLDLAGGGSAGTGALGHAWRRHRASACPENPSARDLYLTGNRSICPS